MTSETRRYLLCAHCGRLHWLPDPTRINENGHIFCDRDCQEQWQAWQAVDRAQGMPEFPAAVAAYNRWQTAFHERVMRQASERRAAREREMQELENGEP